ncbi:hypothetical protein Acsp04_52480 [Actinomadura sp. NBRC 104425]|nr:hypothetical protein Acsp04_52480 [Actinomadura sp. NBRC 104425]
MTRGQRDAATAAGRRDERMRDQTERGIEAAARRRSGTGGSLPSSTMGAVIEMSREAFEDLVGEALDSIPAELTEVMRNVVIVVEDDAPEPGLLGLYQGVPLTERGDWYAGVLPDHISIYRNEILAICETPDEVVDEVRITVVHEIAHHFGIDDERLHELGY